MQIKITMGDHFFISLETIFQYDHFKRCIARNLRALGYVAGKCTSGQPLWKTKRHKNVQRPCLQEQDSGGHPESPEEKTE